MAKHDINELIASGKYDLVLDDEMDLTPGEPISYLVIEGGYVQNDLSVPVTIKMSYPDRLAGRTCKGRLVPSKKKAHKLLSGLDLFSSMPKPEA